MKIRLATLSDAAALAPLAGQLGYPCSEAQIEDRLKNLLGRAGNAVLVAQGADGAILGWIHVFVARRLTSEQLGELGGLVVEESSRSGGVGTALMEAAEQWARDQRCATLRVRSNVVRKRAHRFYRRLGYSRTKQQSVLEKPLRSDSGTHL